MGSLGRYWYTSVAKEVMFSGSVDLFVCKHNYSES